MILVTGGRGYLGGRVVDYLSQSGLKVKIGDRSIFADDDSLEEACQGISCIAHLAAMNAQDCEKYPEEALRFNGLGTLNLLRAAERKSVTKFIYFSTAHIYGMPLKGKINEKSLPRPLHPYSITHRLAEDFVVEADRKEKLSGIVFRLTNGVGYPVRSDANCWMLVANDLCRQVVKNQRMELHSDKFVERDYVPISAICSALYFALVQSRLDGEIVNISAGKSLSLKELTDLIANRTVDVLGFRPTVHFRKESNFGIVSKERLEISNSKLKKTGFAMDADLSDEIDTLLLKCNQWFRV
ncbi:SDR family oxidoreductase [Deltaproteobacteria bacterium]|nr:SDR family oxidoreductase [Deltaproteobacteria bacterium]